MQSVSYFRSFPRVELPATEIKARTLGFALQFCKQIAESAFLPKSATQFASGNANGPGGEAEIRRHDVLYILLCWVALGGRMEVRLCGTYSKTSPASHAGIASALQLAASDNSRFCCFQPRWLRYSRDMLVPRSTALPWMWTL